MISERRRRKMHFRESQVWRVLIETVHGLRAIHEISVMHRDIKSANIFMFKNRKANKNNNSNAQDGEDSVNLYQAMLGDMNVSKVAN